MARNVYKATTLESRPGSVTALALTPDSELILSGDDQAHFLIHATTTGKIRRSASYVTVICDRVVISYMI